MEGIEEKIEEHAPDHQESEDSSLEGRGKLGVDGRRPNLANGLVQDRSGETALPSPPASLSEGLLTTTAGSWKEGDALVLDDGALAGVGLVDKTFVVEDGNVDVEPARRAGLDQSWRGKTDGDGVSEAAGGWRRDKLGIAELRAWRKERERTLNVPGEDLVPDLGVATVGKGHAGLLVGEDLRVAERACNRKPLERMVSKEGKRCRWRMERTWTITCSMPLFCTRTMTPLNVWSAWAG